DRLRDLTPRSRGTSLKRIRGALDQVLRGGFEDVTHARRATVRRADGGVRRRLRAILARRHGATYRVGNAGANVRGPNADVADAGLVSCTTAHALACQS